MSEASPKLALKFSFLTISHLGVLMYQNLPPVLAELVSNAYDADAENVAISFFDGPAPKIQMTDDGNGMSFDEINECFLIIGRNRRESDPGNGDRSPKKGRKVTGKKGIGKLAVFGIADKVTIDTVKDGVRNCFVLDLEAIKGQPDADVFHPELLAFNEPTDAPDGTTLTIERLKLTKPFILKDLATALSPRFAIIGNDFQVSLTKGNETITLDECSKWNSIEIQTEMTYPREHDQSGYEYASQIRGKIVFSVNALPDAVKGIALYARGKLVNHNEFYGIQTSSSFAYHFISGDLHIDFIDEFASEDLITTNRDGLVWANEKLDGLKDWLQKEIRQAEVLWRAARDQGKKEKIAAIIKEPVENWLQYLPVHERALAERMVQEMLSNEHFNVAKNGALMAQIKNLFEFEPYKQYGEQIKALSSEEMDFHETLADLETIETKEFYRLSIIRLEVIRKLQSFWAQGGEPVVTMARMLRSLPWMFGPRAMVSQEDTYFTKLLGRHVEKSKQFEAPGSRPAGFVSLGAADTLNMIVLLNPSVPVNVQDLDRAMECCAVVEDHIKHGPVPYSRFTLCLLGPPPENPKEFEKKLSGIVRFKLYFKSYPEALQEAETFYKSFMSDFEEEQARRKYEIILVKELVKT